MHYEEDRWLSSEVRRGWITVARGLSALAKYSERVHIHWWKSDLRKLMQSSVKGRVRVGSSGVVALCEGGGLFCES